jgi:hypothetical protein
MRRENLSVGPRFALTRQYLRFGLVVGITTLEDVDLESVVPIAKIRHDEA